MQSIGYWEAWTLWWSGQKVDGLQMWGFPMLWWGRSGKIMQFTGGLIAVLDIIGSERLKNAERKVRLFSRIFAKRPRTILLLARRYSFWLPFGNATVAVIYAMYLAVIGGLQLALVHKFDFTRDWLYSNPRNVRFILPGLMLIISMFVAYLLRRVAYMPWAVSAWLFKADRPGHPARWAAFFSIAIGFHIDLLAS